MEYYCEIEDSWIRIFTATATIETYNYILLNDKIISKHAVDDGVKFRISNKPIETLENISELKLLREEKSSSLGSYYTFYGFKGWELEFCNDGLKILFGEVPKSIYLHIPKQ